MLQAGCGFGLQQLPRRPPRVITPPTFIHYYETQGPFVMEAEKPLLALQDCLVDDESAEPGADGQESLHDDDLIDDDDSSIISECTDPLMRSPCRSPQDELEEEAPTQEDLLLRFADVFDMAIESTQPQSPLPQEDRRELAALLHERLTSLAAKGAEAGDPVGEEEIDAWVDLAFQDAPKPLEGCAGPTEESDDGGL
jgi:hypothetical protein